MSSYKLYTILLLLSAMSVVCGCMESVYPFKINDHLDQQFLRQLPGIGAATYQGNPVTVKADSIEIYIASLREATIEKDNLLEITEHALQVRCG